jgi:transcriptional regulator with XRE-family HTH domain
MNVNRRVHRARLRDTRRRIGEDIRRMREDAGLSQAAVARAAGTSPAHLCRIELGGAQASLDVLLRIGAVLGADLSLRYFPNTGPLIRDRFQLPMSECLLGGLHARWRATPEFAIARPVRGIIDHVLEDRLSDDTVAGELQSELRRVEQQVRWSMEKASALAELPAQAERRVSRLLVLRNTHAMREVARAAEETLRAAYPAPSADAIAALTSDVPWPGPAIAWMRVDGGRAALLAGPPRGVAVGR